MLTAAISPVTGRLVEDGSVFFLSVQVQRSCPLPTFGHHKTSRRLTWRSPNGQHHSQIDDTLVRKRFRSGVNIARIQSCPGADIGSDHELMMMTFHLRFKRISKPKHTRLKFDLEKLKDPNVLETSRAMIGGRFASLTIMSNEDTGLDSVITIFSTVVTETASEILGKQRQKKKPCVCLLYTSPSPRDCIVSRMPSSA